MCIRDSASIHIDLLNEGAMGVGWVILFPQEDRFGAVEALIERNWPVISNALKFDPNGQIPIEAVKEAVAEQMLGIFPTVTLPNGNKVSRKTPLFNTYNPTGVKSNQLLKNSILSAFGYSNFDGIDLVYPKDDISKEELVQLFNKFINTSLLKTLFVCNCIYDYIFSK